MSRSRSVLLAAACASISLASNCFAITPTWNTASGTFQTGANWTGGVAPSTNVDKANFASGFPDYTVTFSGNVTNGSLTLSDSGTLNLNGFTYTLFNGGASAVTVDILPNRTYKIRSGTLNCAGGFQIPNFGGDGTVNLLSTATLIMGGGLRLSAGKFINAGTITINSNSLTVGDTGAATVDTSRTITAGGLTIGSQVGGQGTLLMTGASSTVTTLGGAVIGDADDGFVSNPAGTLTIGRGTLGVDAGAIGTVTIGSLTDTGHWNAGTSLIIGNAGRGDVFVQRASDLTVNGALTMASQIGGVGSLRLESGATGSALTTIVGDSGSATLSIRGGSQMSTATFSSANDVGSIGTITVQGSGSSLNTGTSSMTLASNGTMRMNILDGGKVTCGSATVAGGSIGSGIGTVTISGGQAIWHLSGALSVGDFVNFEEMGTAVVNIQPDGILDCGSTITVHRGNTLNLNGGTLNAQQIALFTVGSPTGNQAGVFNFNSGTLSLATLSLGSSFAFPTNFVSDPNHALRISGTLTVGSGCSITTRGGFISTAALSVGAGGELVLDDPSSSLQVGTQLSNSGTIRGNGRILTSFGSLLVNAGGEIRAGSVDHVEFTGPCTNNGLLNLLGGQMEFGGVLTNAATGKITGRGMLQTTSISNSGSILLSSGISDVFGMVTNNSGGKTIVSGLANANFYDAVTNNLGSEFRVSTGSTATFFAPVLGLSFFTGGGVKLFESAASGGPLATAGSSIVDAGGNLSAASIRESSLTLLGGDAQVLPNGTNAGTSRLTQLVISGAPGSWDSQLDLANNALVIDYSGSSPIATVRDQLTTGFAAGAWTGNGITSSSANLAHASAHPTALGYAEASALGVGTFVGQAVDSSALLVRYVYSGDANLDGVVNALDFNAVASNFGAATGKLWNNGDFNYDGTTDSADFTMLSVNFNQALPLAGSGALAPEPGVGLMILTMLPFFRRFRRPAG